jgi:hypothetical protein
VPGSESLYLCVKGKTSVEEVVKNGAHIGELKVICM